MDSAHRHRVVRRFLSDLAVADCPDRATVDYAIRHLYSLDLAAGWGIHCIEEDRLIPSHRRHHPLSRLGCRGLGEERPRLHRPHCPHCTLALEPYKVFCDGTFIRHLIAHSLTPADETLAHLLGGRVLLFTTSCVVTELRSLGGSHAEALAAAQQLVTARCEHEKRVAAVKCIADVVGEGNAEHFFLATQDADLRKKFREIPGVPLIYGLKNSLFIEQPSKHQRDYVASAEEKRLHMSNSEYPRLRKREMDGPENHKTDISSEHGGGKTEVMTTQVTANTYAARQKLGVADKSKFKRKVAKRRWLV